MQTPAASLIISTYNNTDWLQRCLWGYAQQDRTDFELIVADDGSKLLLSVRLNLRIKRHRENERIDR